jgi:hypothetical protein
VCGLHGVVNHVLVVQFHSSLCGEPLLPDASELVPEYLRISVPQGCMLPRDFGTCSGVLEAIQIPDPKDAVP